MTNETIHEIVSISSRRALQRTQKEISPEQRRITNNDFYQILSHEHFTNMYQKNNHIPDELYFFIIILMGVIAYNYSNKIKRFFR